MPIVASVQASSVFLDREATVEKACRLTEEAARAGARVIVFPEAWIPGYPFWIFANKPISTSLFTALYQQAVIVPSPATGRLGEAARRAKAYLVIGVSERAGRSLYNSMLYFAPDGALLGVHRKLMPTHMERTIWGQGDGSGLRLFDTPLGRLGGLICWEHQMTLVKYAMFARGEAIHASVWPAMRSQNAHIEFGTRQYAFEGRCFVIVSCGYLTPALVPERYGLHGAALDANGGSAIINPQGEYLAGPLYDREGILYADLDLDELAAGAYWSDITGHYARPDVVRLVLDDRPRAVIEQPDGSPYASPPANVAAEDDCSNLRPGPADTRLDLEAGTTGPAAALGDAP